MVGIVIGVILIAGGFYPAYLGIKKIKLSATLSGYTVVNSIASVSDGTPVVASGTVVASNTLQSPYSKRSCVYFYSTEEREELDNSKKPPSYVWRRLQEVDPQYVPFFIQDATGSIYIHPEKAEVNAIAMSEFIYDSNTIGPSPNAAPAVQMLESVLQKINTVTRQYRRIRVREYTIDVGASLYVFGIPRMEGGQRAIAYEEGYPLMLSFKGKSALVNSERWKAAGFFAASLLFMAGGIFVLLNA